MGRSLVRQRQSHQPRRLCSPPRAQNTPQLPPRFPETKRGNWIKIHHEVVAMSNQPCSKASNESANPDNATIRIMPKSSETERKEPDIITGRNKKVQTRIVVLSNTNVPCTVSPLTW